MCKVNLEILLFLEVILLLVDVQVVATENIKIIEIAVIQVQDISAVVIVVEIVPELREIVFHEIIGYKRILTEPICLIESEFGNLINWLIRAT